MINNKLQYFGEKEEEAVINFIKSDSLEERNRIYNNILIEPFKIMIQSILRIYPIYIGNYTMYEVEFDALTHLIDSMNKFNPDAITKSGNKTKAYSYCQTIIRNYFIDHGKKSYNESKRKLDFDLYAEELSNDDKYSYELEYNDSDNLELLIISIINKIEEKLLDEKSSLNKNDIIVGNTIINILKDWEVLFLDSSFKKNKILSLIREKTGLSTKDIRLSIKKSFEKIYLFEKNIYKL